MIVIPIHYVYISCIQHNIQYYITIIGGIGTYIHYNIVTIMINVFIHVTHYVCELCDKLLYIIVNNNYCDTCTVV